MNTINDTYNNVIRENEDYESFCEKYKKAHDNLITDLKTYSESLEPSILVPVCSRILMRGNLIHTNEVMVSLGCGYFTKCTSSEAQQICLRRIKRADTMLQELNKERNFVESRMKFSQDNVFSTDLQEIIEPYHEATENKWRDEHAQKMKEYRKKENKEGIDVDHEEIISKLELLELQEEIEELHISEENESTVVPSIKAVSGKTKADSKKPSFSKSKKTIGYENQESREFVLRKKLANLRQRKKNKCSTEEDIFQRLNELEEEEELEDELDRLYDDIYGGQKEEDEEEDSEKSSEECEDDYYSDSSEEEDKLKSEDADKSVVKLRKVSFSGQAASDAKTAMINFSHSDEEIKKTDTADAITSPSDIYKSFPENLKKETKSILKNIHKVKEEVHNDLSNNSEDVEIEQPRRIDTRTQQIILGNIVEHSKDDNESISDAGADQKRPVSKFKSMRNAKKQSK